MMILNMSLSLQMKKGLNSVSNFLSCYQKEHPATEFFLQRLPMRIKIQPSDPDSPGEWSFLCQYENYISHTLNQQK